jgi:3-methyladenine DNA glycosylase AlkC
MAESLKTFFSPALVRRLAADLARVEPSFPSRTFIRAASAGLDQLELLDRGKHISRALSAHLPKDYPNAVDVLLRSLGPEYDTNELIGAGMAPFYYLPHVLFVAERGLDHFDLSMRAQYELTKRFSAESSIRPYIAKDPARTFTELRRWTKDANAHVRRLVSEGTRLRLPWASRVPWLDAHPERVIELLELLKDDPTTLVRRSVANNLNDLGKVHRELLTRTCATWLAGASAERRALVEHALRSAVKRGDADALRVLGYGNKPSISIEEICFDPPSRGDRKKGLDELRAAEQISNAAGAAGRCSGAFRESERSCCAEGLQAEARHPSTARPRTNAGSDFFGRAHYPQAASGHARGGHPGQRRAPTRRNIRGDGGSSVNVSVKSTRRL